MDRGFKTGRRFGLGFITLVVAAAFILNAGALSPSGFIQSLFMDFDCGLMGHIGSPHRKALGCPGESTLPEGHLEYSYHPLIIPQPVIP